MTLRRDLELVASDAEHDGLLHVGVMLDGAFIPLAAVKTGSLEQRTQTPAALEHAASKTSKTAKTKTPTT